MRSAMDRLGGKSHEKLQGIHYNNGSARIALLACYPAAAAASGVPGVPLPLLIRTLSLHAIVRVMDILHPKPNCGLRTIPNYVYLRVSL